MSGDRQPVDRLWMGALLRAIGKVPPGEKLNLRALREPLGIGQSEAIAAIELMIAEGRLDRATLRPPAGAPEPETALSPRQLLAEIAAFLKRSKMPETRFGKEAVNDPALVGRLRAAKSVTGRTVERVRAFIREWRPPSAEPAIEIHECGGCAPPVITRAPSAEARAVIADAMRHPLTVPVQPPKPKVDPQRTEPLPTFLKPAETAWCEQCDRKVSGAVAGKCLSTWCDLKVKAA